jgi:hypothetical protein
VDSVSDTTGLDSTIEVNEFSVGKVHEGALVAQDGLEDLELLWVEPLAMVPLGPVVTDKEVFVGEEELDMDKVDSLGVESTMGLELNGVKEGRLPRRVASD